MATVAYCPACDDEFRPEIKVCSDCGGPLRLQEEGVGASLSSDAESHDLDPDAADSASSLDALPVSSLVPIKTFDSLTDLEPAVAALAAARIASRVLVQSGRYILLLRPESLGDAQSALEARHLEEGSDSDVETGFDPRTGRYAECPACSAALPASGAAECPECGLELGGPAAEVRVPDAE